MKEAGESPLTNDLDWGFTVEGPVAGGHPGIRKVAIMREKKW